MQDQHQPPTVINITYLVQEPAESRGSMVRQGGRCVREQVVILFYFWNSNYHQALPLVWSGLAESLLRNIASWSLLSLSSLPPHTLPANTAEINIWKDWNKEQRQTVRDRHSRTVSPASEIQWLADTFSNSFIANKTSFIMTKPFYTHHHHRRSESC